VRDLPTLSVLPRGRDRMKSYLLSLTVEGGIVHTKQVRAAHFRAAIEFLTAWQWDFKHVLHATISETVEV